MIDDDEEDPTDDGDVYDPESAFPESAPPKPKKPKLDDEPAFSSSNESSPSPPPPKTVTSGGFTEQLAKLTAEIAQKQANLDSMKKADPKNFNNDYPGESSSFNQQPAFSTDLASGQPSKPDIPTGIASILFGGNASAVPEDFN